jgi:adenylate cyclase class IV
VRILSGLMALGYEIGPIMRRTSLVLHNGSVTLKCDDVEGLGAFFQVGVGGGAAAAGGQG